MKYSGIENPSLYDNVRDYSIFNYSDEILLEEELFSIEIIEIKAIERLMHDFSSRYIAIISTKKLEINEIDLEGLKRFIEDECYDIDIENIKIIFDN